MRILVLLSLTVLLGACNFGGEKSEVTIAGKITEVDASEEMIWVDDGNNLYVDEPSDFKVGDIVRITFTDPTETDDWNPDDFEVIDVEFLDDNLYSELREIAWAYLPKEIKNSTSTSKDAAEIQDGFSNVNNPFAELEDENMDNRYAWLLSYWVPGNGQPYKVIIDQETLEVLGIVRPEG